MLPQSENNENELRIEEISDTDTFFRMETQWTKLIAQASNPSLYSTFEWMSAWWKCHGNAQRSLLIFAVFEKEELIAIAPFQIVNGRFFGFPIRKIEFLSMAEYASHPANCVGNLDVIISRKHKEVVQAAVHRIAHHTQKWHFIRLHPLPSNSITITALEEFAVLHGMPFFKQQAILNLCLHMPENWDSFFSTLSRRFRKNLRSSEKDLQESGAVEIKELRTSIGTQPPYNLILDIEKESWKWNKGISINSVVYNNFYRTIIDTASAKGWLRLWILTLNGKPIAYDLCIEFNGSVEALKKGFRESYRNLFPGGVLEWKMLEKFASDGVRTVNFQWGDADHKGNWAPAMESHDEIFIFNNTLFSKLMYFIFFTLSYHALSRIIAGYYHRVLRKLGIRSKNSELTRMDQIVL